MSIKTGSRWTQTCGFTLVEQELAMSQVIKSNAFSMVPMNLQIMVITNHSTSTWNYQKSSVAWISVLLKLFHHASLRYQRQPAAAHTIDSHIKTLENTKSMTLCCVTITELQRTPTISSVLGSKRQRFAMKLETLVNSPNSMKSPEVLNNQV